MSVTGADRPSEPAGLLTERRTQTIIRKIPGLRTSLSPLLYLISVGLIATWVTGVFFGVGFSFLMPRSERLVSGLSVSSTDFSVSLAESPWLLQAMTRLDHLFPEPSQLIGNGAEATPDDRHQSATEPSKPVAVEIGQQAVVPAKPGIGQIARELEGRALSADLRDPSPALSEVVPLPPPRIQPSGATGPQSMVQSSHSVSSRKALQRPTDNRTPQSHAPVQAIQDVLQKHSRLLK